MNIYIAAPYPERRRAQSMAAVLELDGHTITSRWLHHSHDWDDKGVNTDWKRHAAEDIEDVNACDVLIAYNPSTYADKGSGGRHVELGLAIGWGSHILLIGDRTNVFHYMTSVRQIDEGADFRKAVRNIQEGLV